MLSKSTLSAVIHSSKISFADLPLEIYFLVAEFLGYRKHINSLCRTNRRLYNTLNRHLYRIDNRCCGEALFWAVRHGNVATAQLSIQSGCASTARKLFVPDLFRTASQYGHESIVKLLLATFGPIGVGDTDVDDQTPLGWAAKNGHEEVVRVLLETGQVDINKELGWRKRTPFDYAMQNGHFGVAKLLFDAGRKDEALKDQKTQTFLHWAVSKRNEELVTFLLETGQVDVNARDDLGETPIFCALQAGYPKMAKLSLETGRVDACLASDQKPICLSQMKRLVNELL